MNFPGGTLFNWAGRTEDRWQEKGEGFNGYSLLVNGGKGPGPQLNTLEGDPVQLGRDYTDYTDEKTREEEVNGSSFTRINHQRITNNDAHRYAGGVPDEETIIYDGPDISWQEEWKEFTSAIRENREPMGSGRDGMEANRMIEAVYRSVAENRPVRIDEK